MAQDLLSSFSEGFERSIDAFNSGDLDLAVAGLPEEIEWHTTPEDPERSVRRGPEAVKEWFRGFHEIFEEWRVETRGFEQLGESVVLANYVLQGKSQAAAVPVGIEVFEVWEFDGLRPTRVRQFRTREAALSAVADS